MYSKNIGIISAITLIVFIAPSLAIAGTVMVPVGTQITLEFPQVVSPESYEIGQSVALIVQNDVIIGGQVVFEAGSAATGEVTQSETAGGVGKPAKIGVTAVNVEAVDGSMIAVSGTTYIEGEDKQSSTLIITILCCILGLLMKGGDAEIPAGATLDATVDMEAPVTISE